MAKGVMSDEDFIQNLRDRKTPAIDPLEDSPILRFLRDLFRPDALKSTGSAKKVSNLIVPQQPRPQLPPEGITTQLASLAGEGGGGLPGAPAPGNAQPQDLQAARLKAFIDRGASGIQV